MRRVAIAVFLLLTICGCHFVKPRVAIDLTNKSHEMVKNIEVNYPGGTYGLTKLDIYATDHHMAEIDPQKCVLKVKFEDTTGHEFGGDEILIGQPCPDRIRLVISDQLKVSAER